jgi:GH25 family lysozyme M1 (1,4-beta-N-acetylmuramidase)
MGIRSLTAGIAVAAVLFAAAPAAAAPRPQGIDVSRFNGLIAWPSVAAAGKSFAFVAASRGSGSDCLVEPGSCGPDPLWLYNSASARASGVRIGAYHRAFASGKTRARAKADARAEAAVFAAQVGRIPAGDLLPALDVETPFTGLRPGRLRLWIATWMKRVRKATGVRPIVYTNQTSWNATRNTLKFAKRHPLWVAQWAVPRPTLVPAYNWGGRGWSVWQYTSSGSVAGILGRVDLNVAGVPLDEITVG